MGKQQQPTAQGNQGDGRRPSPQQHGEPLVRLVAAHPSRDVVVVAVGTSIRVLDCQQRSVADMHADDGHQGVIRFLAISPDGKYVLTGGDDKLCKLWALDDRKCLATWRINKKLRAGAFSADTRFALFADKFGDVAVAEVSAPAGESRREPDLLLGHLSSIVTSVSVSPDGRLVTTTDKEGRVRVSILPPEPLKGAYEIQSYCMGHKNFVSHAVFATLPGGVVVVVSGSGDGTVRVWEPERGALLAMHVAAPPRGQEGSTTLEEAAAATGEASAKAGNAAFTEGETGPEPGPEAAEAEAEGEGGGGTAGPPDGGEDEGLFDEPVRRGVPDCAAVLRVPVSRDGTLVAALVEEEQHEVQILALAAGGQELVLRQRVAVPAVWYPCDAAWDAAGRLWLVGGPPLDGSTAVHVAVLAQQPGGDLADVTEQVVGAQARAQIERRSEEEEELLAKGELSGKLTVQLRWQNYDEHRHKRRRNNATDVKESLRLAKMRAQEVQERAAQGGDQG